MDVINQRRVRAFLNTGHKSREVGSSTINLRAEYSENYTSATVCAAFVSSGGVY